MEQNDRWWPTRARWRETEAALIRATKLTHIEPGIPEQAPAASSYKVVHKAGKRVIDLTNIDLPPDSSIN